MKTTTPKGAVEPDHDVSVASSEGMPSSNSPRNPDGNPMSEVPGIPAGEDGSMEHTEVHVDSSPPGKFDFGFMANKDDEEKFDVPVHAKGTYPLDDGAETPMAVPTHAPGTMVPAPEADTKPKSE